MPTRVRVLLGLLLIAVLLVPAAAWAKRVTAGGSLTIAGDGVLLTNQLVAVVLTANPGLEKTIVQQLPLTGPLFVAPFFVNEETTSPQQGDLRTTLVLTNTTAAPLDLTITLRGLDGIVLTTEDITLAAHETRLISLAGLLP